MRPPRYIEAIWKDVFEVVIFSSNIIETPRSSGDRAEKRERKKKKNKNKKKKKKKISKSLFK
jgi:hypothetical protein